MYYLETREDRNGGGENLCERQEDHSGMEMDISETGNIGMEGETRGTGTNGLWGGWYSGG